MKEKPQSEPDRSNQENPENQENPPPELTRGLTAESGEGEAEAPESDGNNPAEPAETMPSLKQMLRKAELDASEHHDAWLRAKAEAENIRKRAQLDLASAHKYAIENFSTELLAVMDSLDAALAVENATVENFKNGMELTRKQLAAVFEKFNIKQVNPAEERFDPHLHQAMCTVESDAAPNTVVQVMQKGYVLNDRVIRPALVSVSKPREA